MKTYKVKVHEYLVNEKIHYVNAPSKAEAIKCINSPNFETNIGYVIDSEPDNITGMAKVKIISVEIHSENVFIDNDDIPNRVRYNYEIKKPRL